jgi:histidinol-phosphate/aromatic aminotransferase/cobyric acid decarboxylase-like protein
VTNFLLVDLGGRSAARAMASGLLARGLVPRTFGPDHPLAGHLRFTVRDTAQDGLLIDAFTELAPTARAVVDDPAATEEPRP